MPMPNHPNRAAAAAEGDRRTTPSPEQIRAVRQQLGLSQSQAAAVIFATLRAWQGWEADEGAPDHRRMHPGLFELFMVKTGQWALEMAERADGRKFRAAPG